MVPVKVGAGECLVRRAASPTGNSEDPPSAHFCPLSLRGSSVLPSWAHTFCWVHISLVFLNHSDCLTTLSLQYFRPHSLPTPQRGTPLLNQFGEFQKIILIDSCLFSLLFGSELIILGDGDAWSPPPTHPQPAPSSPPSWSSRTALMLLTRVPELICIKVCFGMCMIFF